MELFDFHHVDGWLILPYCLSKYRKKIYFYFTDFVFISEKYYDYFAVFHFEDDRYDDTIVKRFSDTQSHGCVDIQIFSLTKLCNHEWDFR